MAKKIEDDGGGTIVQLGKAILGGKNNGSSDAKDAREGRTEEEEREKVLKMRMARRGGDEPGK